MLDMIRGFFSTKLSREQQVALVLYERIVATARKPVFYDRGGVPDSLDGRVECIALHAFLVFRRMAGQPGWDEVGGALSDEIVADFDRSLREMGVGDMSIGKKVKKLAQAFFSRFDGYWGAVNGAEGAEDLSDLLRRGLFQGNDVTDEQVRAMTAYFDRQSTHLFKQSETNILKGRIEFCDPEPDFAGLPRIADPVA
ncbi:MAG: ubiquinol-cytochrome C chaperone family protein [Alphaproteobacteria bacterium]|nr:ubiquinol-cytochrome C chaperone family protein [Alphaproteobacteria bacterium]